MFEALLRPRRVVHANGLRGGFRTGATGFASSESFAHAPSVGVSLSGGRSAEVSGTMKGGPAVSTGLAVAGGVVRDLVSGVNRDGCLATPGRPSGKSICSRSLSIFVLRTRKLTASNAPD